MRRNLIVLLLVALSLVPAGAAHAAPGNGQNAVLIHNKCDGTDLVLISQASLAAPYATAHIVGNNKPAPLLSLAYVVSAEIEGQTVVLETGSYAHMTSHRGHPVVTCTGYFELLDPDFGVLTVDIVVTAFFPRGI